VADFDRTGRVVLLAGICSGPLLGVVLLGKIHAIDLAAVYPGAAGTTGRCGGRARSCGRPRKGGGGGGGDDLRSWNAVLLPCIRIDHGTGFWHSSVPIRDGFRAMAQQRCGRQSRIAAPKCSNWMVRG